MGDEQNPLDALRNVRGEKGRFVAGMPGPRLAHGLRSVTLTDVPELAASHREKVAAIEADLGRDLSTLKGAAVTEAARLMLIVDSLGDDLLARGVMTGKGRTRAALAAYGMALDRLHRLMTMLGVERVPAKAASLRDYAKAGNE